MSRAAAQPTSDVVQAYVSLCRQVHGEGSGRMPCHRLSPWGAERWEVVGREGISLFSLHISAWLTSLFHQGACTMFVFFKKLTHFTREREEATAYVGNSMRSQGCRERRVGVGKDSGSGLRTPYM